MPTPQSLRKDHTDASGDDLRDSYLARRNSVIRSYSLVMRIAARALVRTPTNLFIAIVAQAYADTEQHQP